MESVPLHLSLLILCVSGPSLCGATDYYVRPTEPTNASCPGQPCLTLHHYIQNLSSNANYHLLPGVHFINGPITLEHVRNVSMAAFNSSVTKIAATIECNSRGNGSHYSLECSGISFQDTSNITISSLSIELKLLLPSRNVYWQLSIAGMSFMNSTDVVIQGLDVWMKQMWPTDNVVVIAFSDCMNVEMSSLTVTNGGSAVSLEYTRNTTLRNITIHSAGRVGIEMIGSNRSTVSDVHVMQSNGDGKRRLSCHYC